MILRISLCAVVTKPLEIIIQIVFSVSESVFFPVSSNAVNKILLEPTQMIFNLNDIICGALILFSIDFFISSGHFRQCLRYDDITIFCFKFMISIHSLLVVQQDLETYQRPRFTQTLVLWLSQGL